jgi:hypothetical protein
MNLIALVQKDNAVGGGAGRHGAALPRFAEKARQTVICLSLKRYRKNAFRTKSFFVPFQSLNRPCLAGPVFCMCSLRPDTQVRRNSHIAYRKQLPHDFFMTVHLT